MTTIHGWCEMVHKDISGNHNRIIKYQWSLANAAFVRCNYPPGMIHRLKKAVELGVDVFDDVPKILRIFAEFDRIDIHN